MADTKLKSGTIKLLQKHIETNITKWGFDDETLHERLLLLTEELGELVNACRKMSGMKRDKNRTITNEVGEEISDMIILIFAVAKKLDINVEKEFLKKEEIVNKRIYTRDKSQ